MKVLQEKHKLATRWFHWLNFPLLLAMIYSGLVIYWAYDPYRVGVGNVTLFHFFPDWFYGFFGLGQQLAYGMALHFTLAWLFAINGVAYVLYTLISGEWRELAPDRNSPREALQVAMHDAGFNVPLPPQGRYNAAQRITYTAIVLMGGLSLVTGLAIYKPVQIHWLTAALGGYQWARLEHFCLTLGYVAFFAIHIAQVARAGWANFRAMVSGWDLAESETSLAWRTRRSFIGLGVGAVAALGGWKWLNTPGSEEADTPPHLRSVLGFNERVVRSAVYGNAHLVPTFPASAIRPLKKNGDFGIMEEIDLTAWRLEVVPMGAEDKAAKLTLAEIQTLPKVEQTFEFKCIEGWSVVTSFAGARLADFTAKYAAGSEQAAFVGMKTPDETYYIGIDMPGALHPQTLLAYEMNGQPLTPEHGAPLRLVVPVKYGIKNIKRIGRIEYTNERPDDYWAEYGYDYYAGL